MAGTPPPPPEIPQKLLDQVLSDPEAVTSLQKLAARAGVETPVGDMPRDEQVALVTAMMGLAQRAEARRNQPIDGMPEAANSNMPGNPADIPAELVEQVFADPRADPILRDIMDGNQLSGEPADLADDVKRAIVQMLIDQGVISFDEP